jgi:hypothetical protein
MLVDVRSLGGDLFVVGDDPNMLTPLDVVQSVRNHLHDRRRHLGRLLFGTKHPHQHAHTRYRVPGVGFEPTWS